VLEDSAKVGRFVELKNTVVGEGAKVPHLSYIGDADIGESRTRGDVRVAVDTMVVAPVTVGDDAWTAAGSVVTDDVRKDALLGFPPRQVVREGRGGHRDD
jgi:bifunctional UDP-N-acetylglucosamine pyrophosphorylase / glucosamine-1-phosphate N-acetyltransferase